MREWEKNIRTNTCKLGKKESTFIYDLSEWIYAFILSENNGWPSDVGIGEFWAGKESMVDWVFHFKDEKRPREVHIVLYSSSCHFSAGSPLQNSI